MHPPFGCATIILRPVRRRPQRAFLGFFASACCNAVLDFWNWWAFVVAQQRLVARVRRRLFAHVLRQEIGFFDATPSAELASRLSADCGQISNDLTWAFRRARTATDAPRDARRQRRGSGAAAGGPSSRLFA